MAVVTLRLIAPAKAQRRKVRRRIFSQNLCALAPLREIFSVSLLRSSRLILLSQPARFLVSFNRAGMELHAAELEGGGALGAQRFEQSF